MTYKQFETSREIRLWIGQVAVPVLAGAACLLANKEIRQKVSDKVKETKKSLKNKFSRS